MDAPWSKFQSSLKELIEMKCDIVGLSEINVDTQKPSVMHRLRSDLRSQFHHNHMIAGSSPVSSQGTRKPGGTMSLALGDIVGRISGTHVDMLGRWTAQHLRGKGGQIITVVSVYQACYQTRTPFTVWNQQRAALAAQQRQLTPDKAFARDLLAFLRECASKDHLLIVAGDFNAIFEATGILHDLCSDPTLDLLDVIGLRHPTAVDAPTYDRKNARRLDYALISSALLDSVQLCGYLPFDKYVTSDHRFLYLDLNTDTVFGDPAKLAPKPRRDIQANLPTLVTTYLEGLQHYLLHQNFWPRLDKLKSLTSPDSDLAERLDKVLTDAKLHAEKQCRQDRRYWWSLPLAKAEELARYYHVALTALRRKEEVPERNPYRQKLLNIVFEIPDSVAHAYRLLRDAKEKRNEIRRKSRMYRDEYLQQLIADAEKDENPTLSKVYRDMFTQEKNNRHWKRISTLKEEARSQVTQVQIPVSHRNGTRDESGNLEDPKKATDWCLIDHPPEVNKTFSERNSDHFSQALGTPFTIPPLSRDFDWEAVSESVDLVLNGDYDSSALPDIQQEFLKRCQLKIPVPESSDLPLLTADQWRYRVKKWKERTTTSPSGLHLGHAKALLNHYCTKTQKDPSVDLSAFQTKMIDAHVALLNYATKFQHSFDRWKTIINLMIHKEPGNDKIHRLRVIHLYEYDFSLYLAVYWKKMMKEAESRGSIHDGQYGGRKHRSPQALVLFEELKNEICRFSRKNLVNFDNDAASCYDRILPNVASLLGRTKGLHKHVIFVHATTLKHARYKLKTALGVSDEFSQHCDLKPWFGTGQGSTNSPMIWTLVSSALFDIHDDQAHGAEFMCPDFGHHIRLTIVGFVDDSNCNTNMFWSDCQKDLEELIRRATKDAQLWSDLLWLSGGLLELSKCSYHIIHFDFNSSGVPYMSESTKIPIHLTSPDGKSVEIEQKAVDAAHKTLGHLKAPNDNGKNQLDAIGLWCKSFASKIHRFPLRPSDAKIFYHQVATPKFKFVLPQCYLTAVQLNRVSAGFQSACVRASGFSGSMSKMIRYGPVALGGGGFTELYTHQGCGQILNLLQFLRSHTMLRRIWITALSWAQLSAGVDFPILEKPKVALPYLEGCYIKSLRDFLASIDGSMTFSEEFVPCQHREGDMHLMTYALKNLTFKPHEWKILNCTRLYFKAVTISDIATVDGTCVHPAYVDFSESPDLAEPIGVQVNQPRHCLKHHEYIWRRLTSSIDRSLHYEPLGAWTCPPSQHRMLWRMYFDFESDSIFYRLPNADEYTVYYPCGNDAYRRSDDTAITVPETSCPTSCLRPLRNPTYLRDVFRPKPPTYLPTQVPRTSTFMRYLDALDANMAVFFARLEWITYPKSFFTRLNASTSADPFLIIVSDGSAPTEAMSFGWVCADHTGTRLAKCSGPAFGSASSSQRAESFGFLAQVMFVYHCFVHFNLKPEWRSALWCDNESLINTCNKHISGEWQVGDTLLADWDLIAPIIHFVNLLPNPVSIKHVYGHQDRNIEYKDMELEGQLNHDADLLATAYRHNPASNLRESTSPFPGNPVNLILRKRVVTTRHSEQIHFAASGPALINFMCTHFNWSEWTYLSIDWIYIYI